MLVFLLLLSKRNTYFITTCKALDPYMTERDCRKRGNRVKSRLAWLLVQSLHLVPVTVKSYAQVVGQYLCHQNTSVF